MANICSELCYKVEMSGLSGGMAVVVGFQREGEGFVISENVKMSPLHEMPEVSDG